MDIYFRKKIVAFQFIVLKYLVQFIYKYIYILYNFREGIVTERIDIYACTFYSNCHEHIAYINL